MTTFVASAPALPARRGARGQLDSVVMSSAELAALEANERKMWARIVKVANIKAD